MSDAINKTMCFLFVIAFIIGLILFVIAAAPWVIIATFREKWQAHKLGKEVNWCI